MWMAPGRCVTPSRWEEPVPAKAGMVSPAKNMLRRCREGSILKILKFKPRFQTDFHFHQAAIADWSRCYELLQLDHHHQDDAAVRAQGFAPSCPE